MTKEEVIEKCKKYLVTEQDLSAYIDNLFNSDSVYAKGFIAEMDNWHHISVIMGAIYEIEARKRLYGYLDNAKRRKMRRQANDIRIPLIWGC
jgi:hypothetical protein